MATVATQTPKINKAFFAQMNGAPGMLFQGQGGVVFQDEATDRLTAITPANALQVVVLGEMTLANGARRADGARGGYARIACAREEGRQ